MKSILFVAESGESALAAASVSDDTKRSYGAVDVSITDLPFYGGLRRSEVASFAWGDFESSFGVAGAVPITARRSKTGRTGERADVCLVKGPTAAALVGIRPLNADPRTKAIGLGAAQIKRRLAAAAEEAGIDVTGRRLSAQPGRSALASELTKRGAPAGRHAGGQLEDLADGRSLLRGRYRRGCRGRSRSLVRGRSEIARSAITGREEALR